jgi:hypothetical protein
MKKWAQKVSLTVDLIGKRFCPLCMEVQMELEKLQESYPLTIRHFDIDLREHLEFKRKYHLEIPVILMEGKEVLNSSKHKFSRKVFEQVLKNRQS